MGRTPSCSPTVPPRRARGCRTCSTTRRPRSPGRSHPGAANAWRSPLPAATRHRRHRRRDRGRRVAAPPERSWPRRSRPGRAADRADGPGSGGARRRSPGPRRPRSPGRGSPVPAPLRTVAPPSRRCRSRRRCHRSACCHRCAPRTRRCGGRPASRRGPGPRPDRPATPPRGRCGAPRRSAPPDRASTDRRPDRRAGRTRRHPSPSSSCRRDFCADGSRGRAAAESPEAVPRRCPPPRSTSRTRPVHRLREADRPCPRSRSVRSTSASFSGCESAGMAGPRAVPAQWPALQGRAQFISAARTSRQGKARGWFETAQKSLS